MKTIFILTLSFYSLISVGQNIHFLKSYGNSGYDFGRDIKQDLDTGYIVTGSSSSFNTSSADAFLLKVDSLGNFKWSYNYGGTGSEWGESLILTLDSGYAIAGHTNSFGAGGFDFYFIKTNPDGTPEFEKTYGGSDWDKALGIIQTLDSGYVLVGETYSFGSGLRDGYIVRTDKFGDTLWTKVIGGPLDDYFSEVIMDGDSIVICGATESFGSGKLDGHIIKLGLDGNIGWQKYVGKVEDDYFTSIVKKNNYYCLGGAKTEDVITSSTDFWVYKISTDGLVEIIDTGWTGDQFGTDITYDIIVEPTNERIFYGGSTTSWGTVDITQGYQEAFISKLSTTYGWLSYVQNFGDFGDDIIFQMDSCTDKGIVAVGVTDFFSTGGSNIFIVKIDFTNSFGFILFSGEVEYENITNSIDEVVDVSNILVYPNPFTDMINVNSNAEIQELIIYDISGKIIMRKYNPENEIDLRQLAKGTYILNLIYESGKSSVKLIKD